MEFAEAATPLLGIGSLQGRRAEFIIRFNTLCKDYEFIPGAKGISMQDEPPNFPDHETLQRELSDYLSKKYGYRIKVISPMTAPEHANEPIESEKKGPFYEEGKSQAFNLQERSGSAISPSNPVVSSK